ncbi:Protein LMBR1L-like protein [Dinothrombium tinctorium]|uniref:Protein LMBR1L-like protein n=1 Tax=Dinothrombium tinctorium TaxID=1965070 RepID=A0A3S3PL79_9ACAR|nr:Protein LMBR1L-like protein [Dinothrombium tinctorium]
MSIFEDPPDEIPTDPREQEFHNMVREYVIFILILITLYGWSYCLISSFMKRREDLFADEEDALVYRISFWMCAFSFAISIGATLLLPFSIVTNEVLLLYPDSFYIQWLNESLIHGLWNYVFLFSNISLFVLLPFAYLFTESEGFSGSSKGIMARVNETIILLLLLSVLIFGMTYLLCCFLGYSNTRLTNLFAMWQYFPFLYSCVSFLGVVLLLLCTPVGIARLFTVLGELIVKPKFLRNVQEEYEVAILEEMNLRRKINSMSISLEKSKSLPSLSASGNKDEIDPHYVYPNSLSSNITKRFRNTDVFKRFQNTKTFLSELMKTLAEVEIKRKELEQQKRASAFRRNIGYPLAMLLLLCLTIFAALLVVHNTLELLVGIKALPLSSQHIPIGIESLSKMGHFGACLEIILILYLWSASVVGLYTLPLLNKLRPRLRDTSFTQIVINCALLLVLSSALPVLARTVGITNFDLLGDFGRIEWLGNFYVVLSYNLVFAVTTALSLTNKFTASVRRELFKRLRALIRWFKWSEELSESTKVAFTVNGKVTSH